MELKLITDFEKKERRLNFLHPDRHKTIHLGYCKKCPSHNDALNGRTDLETEDIKHLPKELIAREYVFVCAWRENALCRGICDTYGIDQAYLDSIHNP